MGRSESPAIESDLSAKLVHCLQNRFSTNIVTLSGFGQYSYLGSYFLRTLTPLRRITPPCCWGADADEKRDRLLTSPTAWKPQYQTEGDLDDMKIPECAEAFMMVLSAMTGGWWCETLLSFRSFHPCLDSALNELDFNCVRTHVLNHRASALEGKRCCAVPMCEACSAQFCLL